MVLEITPHDEDSRSYDWITVDYLPEELLFDILSGNQYFGGTHQHLYVSNKRFDELLKKDWATNVEFNSRRRSKSKCK